MTHMFLDKSKTDLVFQQDLDATMKKTHQSANVRSAMKRCEVLVSPLNFCFRMRPVVPSSQRKTRHVIAQVKCVCKGVCVCVTLCDKEKQGAAADHMGPLPTKTPI